MGFNQLLQFIAQGEPVAPGVTNRPTRQLAQNANYLWELLQALRIGQAIYAYQVSVEAEAAVGMPVYRNAAAARYERALAATSTTVAGTVLTADSAQVVGVVARKHNSTLADILLWGIDTIDVTAATAETAAGLYYLSAQTPGGLTQQRPPVSVAVLRVLGNGQVMVMPQIADFLDRHVHHRFALTCLPAGTTSPPLVGDRHVITAADADLPGWLPAGHASFAGKAPAGAVFGYNLAADPDLQNVWPPLPLEQCELLWNRATDAAVGGTAVPLGRDGLCLVDRFGIWWLSDCYQDVPWPFDLDTGAGLNSFSDSSTPECPRHINMSLLLFFTRLAFVTDAAVVTSLVSHDSRLTVRCSTDGLPATAGPLALDLDLGFLVSTTTARGAVVLKELNDSTFTRGPVLEGLYALSDNVTLTSDRATVKLVPGDTASPDVYQGMVGMTVAPQATLELTPQNVRLDGVEEVFFQETMYLAFRRGVITALRAKFVVPGDLALPTPQAQVRFWLLGRAAGTLPALTVTARRIPRPTNGLVTPATLPDDTAEFAVTVTTTATLASANQYVEATSAAFTVAAGDQVYVTIERTDDDAYAGELGLLESYLDLTSAP